MPEILLSGYFREELQQKIWRRGLSWESPIGSCLVPMAALPYQTTTGSAKPGPPLVHIGHQQFTPPPHPAPISYLICLVQLSLQEKMAMMEIRQPASTKVGPWGSSPVKEAGGSWAGLPLGRARVGMAASGHPSLLLAPPTDLLRSASCPSGNQGAISPGGTSVKGVCWTLTSFSAWHRNQSAVWFSGKEKLAGCPGFRVCCMWMCPLLLTSL